MANWSMDGCPIAHLHVQTNEFEECSTVEANDHGKHGWVEKHCLPLYSLDKHAGGVPVKTRGELREPHLKPQR